jgi:hypothetical protein
MYIHALTLAQLDRWDQADAFFTRIRQLHLPAEFYWAPRDFLLDKAGLRRLVQGKITQGAERDFFFADDLQKDFQVDRRSSWQPHGQADFAYILFSFGGPRAVDRHVGMVGASL